MTHIKKFEKENIPCDDINLDSWNAMPMSLRIKDFCNHCEFKCEHGKEMNAILRKEDRHDIEDNRR